MYQDTPSLYFPAYSPDSTCHPPPQIFAKLVGGTGFFQVRRVPRKSFAIPIKSTKKRKGLEGSCKNSCRPRTGRGHRKRYGGRAGLRCHASFDVESSVAIKGTFQKWDASLTFQTRELSTGVLEIRIQADSVDTGSGVKNGKLKGKAFFNAKEDSYITFRSTKIRQTGPASFEADGDFTIRGVTKKETLKVDYSGKRDLRGTIMGTMAFDRKNRQPRPGQRGPVKWKRVAGLPPAFEQ